MHLRNHRVAENAIGAASAFDHDFAVSATRCERCQLRVRCAWGKRDAMKSIRECVRGAELDLESLVWTRGPSFPIADLASRMKCPKCGSRRVRITFDVPKEPTAAAATASHWTKRMTG
jgi:hypothetical protein